MVVKVNEHKCEIVKTPVNEKEINITKVEFEFADVITDEYVKEAYFTLNGETYKQIIVNNECDIPYEVLTQRGQIEIGVVAYLVEDEEEIKRYNPSPAYFETWIGSLKDAENTQPITPSEMEQFEQALQDGLNELSDAIENAERLDIDISKDEKVTLVTITRHDGSTKTEQILDGQDGQDGKDGINGQNGEDGISPIATVTETDSGAVITITDKNGTTTANVYNGQDGKEYDDTEIKADISDLEANKADKTEIPDVSNFITKNVNDLTYYTLGTATGSSIDMSIDSSTYVLTISLKNSSGTILNTKTVDLPLETVVVDGIYNNTSKKIILTLENGNTIEIPVGDLISGLQSEITSSNKLSSDLVDDTNNTNKFVTTSEKTTWNNKSDFSGNYNDLTNKPTIPTKLSDLTNDNNTVTDSNYVHTDNNYTSEEKTKLSGIEANAQANTIENISVNGIAQMVTNKSVNINLKDIKVYGIKRSLTTSSSQWHRIDDSIGLEANATQDGSTVYNDFDNIYPWSDIYTYNYDTTTGLEVARIGDANFKFDGTNGEVLTKIPEFYYRRWRDNEYEYMQISKYAVDGFIKSEAFSVGRYNSSVDNGIIHSYSGAEPEVNRDITSFRTLSKAVGANFGQLDWRYFLIQMLYLVEYADYNSQSKLGNGATGFRNNTNDKALVAETGVNRIIVSTSVAGYFDVGQQISIGTSSNGNFGVARCRTITSKEDYSSGGVTGKAVYFDGDAVNIAVGNVLWTSAQKSGTCDGLGMKSGCYKTPKNACIYRGIENPFGNVFQWIDGINITNYVAYICYDPSEYVVDKFTEPYFALGYINANTSDKYATKLGYDENHPLISLTTECVSGSDSTNMCDYYYCNSGNRVARVGGHMYDITSEGLWYWHLGSDSSSYHWHFGSRLLRY